MAIFVVRNQVGVFSKENLGGKFARAAKILKHSRTKGAGESEYLNF